MSKKNILISFILSLIICFNCSSFRRNTYAVAVAIPVIAVGGDIALKLTAAAVAAVAGIIVGLGITSETAEDNDKIVKDFVEYDAKTYGTEHTIEMLEDAGFVTEVEEDGSVVVDVPRKSYRYVYRILF